ncbi:hypothetical protein [Cellulomonas carbonis]|uniref:Uncharacterized protein n=1 Tax=Cellulomonas carbonis T26 TaxID=947969 RepID=A0A0A0BRB6_9CELL|nr:hypothetical protein [Cellulomonas carbonis]KGM10162.1 hypothetical protein N868_16510 [Cellulomonas carbonis T26]GGC08676.1 hypothetical protein GCM10010972_22460 [Cellulomonas carbonis]
MPCTTELNRKDDKFQAWRNAYDDWEEARNLALAADAAMAVSCGVAIWTLGGFGFTGAACAAAVTALAIAVAKVDTARDKSNNAGDAYQLASDRYNDCLAACRPGAS